MEDDDGNPYRHNGGEDQVALVNSVLWRMKDIYLTYKETGEVHEDDLFGFGLEEQWVDGIEESRGMIYQSYDKFLQYVNDAVNKAGKFKGQSDSLEVDLDLNIMKKLFDDFKTAASKKLKGQGIKERKNAMEDESIAENSRMMSSKQMLAKLSKEMQGTHTGASDPNSDWSKYVLSHKRFTLKDIQVDKIPTAVKSDGMSQANIEKYKKADATKFPPVVIGKNGYLLDGNHRLQAYKYQGIKRIKAYIGESLVEGMMIG